MTVRWSRKGPRPAELVPQELGHAPDRPERIPDLVGEGERHLAERGEPLPAPDLGLEGADPRQVPQHGDRAAQLTARAVDGRRQHAHRDRAPVGGRDLRLRLGPALGQADRLARCRISRASGAQALGQGPLERARRRPPDERLGGARSTGTPSGRAARR